MTQDPKPARAADQIDANLKRVYEGLLEEQVPDRFTDLLAQLKQADATASKTGAHDDD